MDMSTVHRRRRAGAGAGQATVKAPGPVKYAFLRIQPGAADTPSAILMREMPALQRFSCSLICVPTLVPTLASVDSPSPTPASEGSHRPAGWPSVHGCECFGSETISTWETHLGGAGRGPADRSSFHAGFGLATCPSTNTILR